MMITKLLMLLLPQHIESKVEEIEYAIQVNAYRVLQSFNYKDKQLGLITIEKGEMLRRFIDDPDNYSNGMSIIPERVLEYNTQLFKPIFDNEHS